jgi:hypothetical protein
MPNESELYTCKFENCEKYNTRHCHHNGKNIPLDYHQSYCYGCKKFYKKYETSENISDFDKYSPLGVQTYCEKKLSEKEQERQELKKIRDESWYSNTGKEKLGKRQKIEREEFKKKKDFFSKFRVHNAHCNKPNCHKTYPYKIELFYNDKIYDDMGKYYSDLSVKVINFDHCCDCGEFISDENDYTTFLLFSLKNWLNICDLNGICPTVYNPKMYCNCDLNIFNKNGGRQTKQQEDCILIFLLFFCIPTFALCWTPVICYPGFWYANLNNNNEMSGCFACTDKDELWMGLFTQGFCYRWICNNTCCRVCNCCSNEKFWFNLCVYNKACQMLSCSECLTTKRYQIKKHCSHDCHKIINNDVIHCSKKGCNEHYDNEQSFHCDGENGCHKNYTSNEEHCSKCHQNYTKGNKHCCSKYKSCCDYDKNLTHCEKCHHNYSENEKHCCIYKINLIQSIDIESDAHHYTKKIVFCCNYDKDLIHCNECHHTYNENQKHCCNDKKFCSNYNKNFTHCQNCHYTFDKSYEDHCCNENKKICRNWNKFTHNHCKKCHKTFQKDENHCQDCCKTYNDNFFHCRKCHCCYKNSESCPICNENNENKCILCNNNLRKTFCRIGCQHKFHMECMQNWIKDNNKCPVCNEFHKQNDEKYYDEYDENHEPINILQMVTIKNPSNHAPDKYQE